MADQLTEVLGSLEIDVGWSEEHGEYRAREWTEVVVGFGSTPLGALRSLMGELQRRAKDLPVCRGCREPIRPSEESAEVAAYKKYPVHEGCKREAKREEARACQVIDADCNDCAHFDRDLSYDPPKGYATTCWPGRCEKYDEPTTAHPNTCTQHECIEHRLKDSSE